MAFACVFYATKEFCEMTYHPPSPTNHVNRMSKSITCPTTTRELRANVRKQKYDWGRDSWLSFVPVSGNRPVAWTTIIADPPHSREYPHHPPPPPFLLTDQIPLLSLSLKSEVSTFPPRIYSTGSGGLGAAKPKTRTLLSGLAYCHRRGQSVIECQFHYSPTLAHFSTANMLRDFLCPFLF